MLHGVNRKKGDDQLKISDVTEATGLNQSQIAAKLGLHRSAITRWAMRGIPPYREAQMRELIAQVRADKEAQE